MEDNLEQMRRQISLLKGRLAQHEIVSDESIERTIGRYIKEYNRTRRQNLIMMTAVTVSAPLCLYNLRIPVWFIFLTISYFFVAICYELLSHDRIDETSFSDSDMVSISAKAAKMIRRNGQWLLFGIPMSAVWLALFAREIIRVNGGVENSTFLLAGAVTGGIIGGIIGLKRYRRSRDNARAIIDEVNRIRSQN